MSRDALISQGLVAGRQPPTDGSDAGCAGVRSQRPRTVYVVESSPGLDPAKGEEILLLWLRERLAE